MDPTFKRFPPQWAHLLIPTSPRRATLAGLTLYAPCRPLGRGVQALACQAVHLAGSRALPGPATTWIPPMGVDAWEALWQEWQALGPIEAFAVYERPQSAREGMAAMLMSGEGPVAFVRLRSRSKGSPAREFDVLAALDAVPHPGVWIPRPLLRGRVGEWEYLAMSALPPRRHAPPASPDLDGLLGPIRSALEPVLPRGDAPGHWEPMHGDLTPWNLRNVPGTGLALLDWEDARWGPPRADATLYLLTRAAMGDRRALPPLPREALDYWRNAVAARRDDNRAGERLRTAFLDVVARAPSTPPARPAPVDGDRRPRLLLSAFGCHPDWGSEPEVGFRALMAVARHCEVWVLTIPSNVEALERHLADHPWRASIHLVPVPVRAPEAWIDGTGVVGFNAIYDLWQRRAGRVAAALDREVDFDVVHHVTVSAHWARVGVLSVPKPLVWGPVGGGVDIPAGLLGQIGVRGLLAGPVRSAARNLLTNLPHGRAAQARAAVILAQNESTAARMRTTSSRVRVVSNATCVRPGDDVLRGVERRSDVIMAGRLLPWKGPRLALRVLRRLEHDDAVLRVFGRGSERRRIERLARRWGLADRVRFERWVPRAELLREVASAGVLLHCALHEEAGLVVAEALSLGTPVVCLAHGGPHELVQQWPQSPSAAIAPTTAEKTAEGLAHAVDRFLDDPPPVPARAVRPVTDFGEQLLRAYEAATGAPVTRRRS